MALFSRKKKTPSSAKASEGKENKDSLVLRSFSEARDLTPVLRHARITEKATVAQSNNVYVFDVAVATGKRDIMQAVKSLYGVTPRKVAVVNIKRKNVRNARTGRTGVKGGGKKAYVYLKKGDSITLA